MFQIATPEIGSVVLGVGVYPGDKADEFLAIEFDVVVALLEDLCHKMRAGDKGVDLAQEKLTAGPGTGALREVPRQDDSGSGSREPRCQDRGPDIPAMMAVNDLDSPASDDSRC